MFIYLTIYQKKNPQNWLNLPSLWMVTTLTTSQNWPKFFLKKIHVGGRSFTIICKVTQKEYKKPNDIYIYIYKVRLVLMNEFKVSLCLHNASCLYPYSSKAVKKLSWICASNHCLGIWLPFLTNNHWTRNDQKTNNFTYLQSRPKYKTVIVLIQYFHRMKVKRSG